MQLPCAHSRKEGKVITRVFRVVRVSASAVLVGALLILAFAWEPFFSRYSEARAAFARGGLTEGLFSGVLPLLALLLPAIAAALVLVVVGGKLGTAMWGLTKGRPALRSGLTSARFGLVSAAVVAAGVALFTWLPNGYKPIEHPFKKAVEESEPAQAVRRGIEAASETLNPIKLYENVAARASEREAASPQEVASQGQQPSGDVDGSSGPALAAEPAAEEPAFVGEEAAPVYEEPAPAFVEEPASGGEEPAPVYEEPAPETPIPQEPAPAPEPSAPEEETPAPEGETPPPSEEALDPEVPVEPPT